MLCLVQGWTHEEAARALEWPLGTVKSRLTTARDTLRGRLSRRGLDAPDGLLTALPLSWRLAPAATIGRLLRLTQLAIDCANPAASPGTAATARALELSRGVLRTMIWKKMLHSLAYVVLAVSTAGGVALAYQREGRNGVSVQTDRSKTVNPPIDRQRTNRPVQRDVLKIAYQQAEHYVRSIEDPAERTEKILYWANSRISRGSLEEARSILSEALVSVAKIPKDSQYVFPHPIIRIAEAQAKVGDRDAAHRMFLRAVKVVASETLGRQEANWINLIPIQVAIEGRGNMAHTFPMYGRFLETRGKARFGASFARNDLLIHEVAESGRPEDILKLVRSPDFGAGRDDLDSFRINAVLKAISYFGPDERDRVRPLLREARNLIHPNPDFADEAYQLQSLAREECG